jgi:hypothetical protein
VARAERARLELFASRRVERGPRCSGTLRPAGSDDGDASRLWIAAKLAAQLWRSAFSMNGRKRSIGAGKTIVVACEEPSSSSVWR